MTSQVEIPQEVRRIFGLRAKKLLTDHAREDTDLRTELEEGLIWAFRVGLKARRDKPAPSPEGPVVFSSRRTQPRAANTDYGAPATGVAPGAFRHAQSVGIAPPRRRGMDPGMVKALQAFGFEAYGEFGERDEADSVFWRPIPVVGGVGYTWAVSRRVGSTLYEHSEIFGTDLKPCIERDLFYRASLSGSEGTMLEDEIYIASDSTRAAYLACLSEAAA